MINDNDDNVYSEMTNKNIENTVRNIYNLMKCLNDWKYKFANERRIYLILRMLIHFKRTYIL